MAGNTFLWTRYALEALRPDAMTGRWMTCTDFLPPLLQIRHSFNTIFGVFDADKRHERPRTAPPAPEPKKDDK